MPVSKIGTNALSSGLDVSSTNISYTGTLTGGTGVVNIGSGQVYKDASGNVGIGTSSPSTKLHVSGDTAELRVSNAANTQYTYMLRDGFYSVGGNLDIYAGGANPIRLWTNASERARIDSSGNLLVGATSGSGRLRVVNSSDPGGGVIQFIEHSSNSDSLRIDANTGGSAGTSVYVLPVRTAGTLRGGIQWNGSNLLYNNASDYRLKEEIKPMTGALARVAALKPCTYKWKETGISSQGFIAHELQAVVPDCVTGEKDAVDADGKPIYQGIDTSFLVATLTAAIQELKSELDSVKAELAVLKGV